MRDIYTGYGAAIVYRIDRPGQHTVYSHRPIGQMLPKGARPVAVVAKDGDVTKSKADRIETATAKRAVLRASITAGDKNGACRQLLFQLAHLHPVMGTLRSEYATRWSRSIRFDMEQALFTLAPHEAAVLCQRAVVTDAPFADFLVSFRGGVSSFPGEAEGNVPAADPDVREIYRAHARLAYGNTLGEASLLVDETQFDIDLGARMSEAAVES